MAERDATYRQRQAEATIQHHQHAEIVARSRGLYLCTEFFAHGQLYTAISRAQDPTKFAYFQGIDGKAPTTKNVVWPKIFE